MTLACAISLLIIVGGVLLLLRKGTFIAKRKSAQYLVLASVGLLFYLRDDAALALTFPSYEGTSYNYLLYYLVAVPVHIFPIMARSWRILCIYRPTHNWRCSMDRPFAPIPRKHLWMFSRMLVWYIPWAVVGALVCYNIDISFYIFIGFEGIYGFAELAINWKLFTMRTELRARYLDETKSLLAYSIISQLQWAWTNILYLYIFDWDGDQSLLVLYVYGDFFFITLMWSLTTGKALLRVWMRSHIHEDKKVEFYLSKHIQVRDSPNGSFSSPSSPRSPRSPREQAHQLAGLSPPVTASVKSAQWASLHAQATPGPVPVLSLDTSSLEVKIDSERKVSEVVFIEIELATKCSLLNTPKFVDTVKLDQLAIMV